MKMKMVGEIFKKFTIGIKLCQKLNAFVLIHHEKIRRSHFHVKFPVVLYPHFQTLAQP